MPFHAFFQRADDDVVYGGRYVYRSVNSVVALITADRAGGGVAFELNGMVIMVTLVTQWARQDVSKVASREHRRTATTLTTLV